MLEARLERLKTYILKVFQRWKELIVLINN